MSYSLSWANVIPLTHHQIHSAKTLEIKLQDIKSMCLDNEKQETKKKKAEKSKKERKFQCDS